MSAHDDLIAALTAERFNGGGWRTPPKHWNARAVNRDDDITTAQRRRDLVEAWSAFEDESEASA